MHKVLFFFCRGNSIFLQVSHIILPTSLQQKNILSSLLQVWNKEGGQTWNQNNLNTITKTLNFTLFNSSQTVTTLITNMAPITMVAIVPINLNMHPVRIDHRGLTRGSLDTLISLVRIELIASAAYEMHVQPNTVFFLWIAIWVLPLTWPCDMLLPALLM